MGIFVARRLRTLQSASELITALFTFVLAVATTALVVTAIIQHSDSVKAIDAMNRFTQAAEDYATQTKIIASASKTSADTAHDQLSVMRGQLDVAEKSVVTVQRAFVVFKELTYSKLPNYQATEPTGIRFIVSWENSGTTPTKHLLTRLAWEVFTPDIPSNFDFPDRGPAPLSHPSIGPKSSINTASLDIPIDVFQAVKAGTYHLYIWGWAEYNDIFDNTDRHRTEFCTEVLAPGNLADPIPELVFIVRTEHNGADGDAMKKPTPFKVPTRVQ
jgi:hypothetical protein